MLSLKKLIPKSPAKIQKNNEPTKPLAHYYRWVVYFVPL